MKILLTGGAGFIGSNFICSALEKGYKIINVDKLTYAGCLDNLGENQSHKNHIFYKVDICDREKLQEIFEKHQPDAVIHMAAESHVDRSIDCADVFIRTNIIGTHTLLEVALEYFTKLNNQKKNNFRFVHLSTDEVYGALDSTGIFNESMPYRPNSPYSASKASSDMLVRVYHKTYNLPTIIINSSNNYGPRQYPEKLIPLTILNALEHKSIPVYGNGQQVRDWLYVDDHVQALLAILHKGKVGESYCIGADNEMTNLMLVNKICEVIDNLRPSSEIGSYKDLISFVQDRPSHDFRYATDASKLKKDIGWKPKMSFKKGLDHTIQWYLDHYDRVSFEDARKRIGLFDSGQEIKPIDNTLIPQIPKEQQNLNLNHEGI